MGSLDTGVPEINLRRLSEALTALTCYCQSTWQSRFHKTSERTMQTHMWTLQPHDATPVLPGLLAGSLRSPLQAVSYAVCTSLLPCGCGKGGVCVLLHVHGGACVYANACASVCTTQPQSEGHPFPFLFSITNQSQGLH